MLPQAADRTSDLLLLALRSYIVVFILFDSIHLDSSFSIHLTLLGKHPCQAT
jgi:hypothetical protein